MKTNLYTAICHKWIKIKHPCSIYPLIWCSTAGLTFSSRTWIAIRNFWHIRSWLLTACIISSLTSSSPIFTLQLHDISNDAFSHDNATLVNMPFNDGIVIKNCICWKDTWPKLLCSNVIKSEWQNDTSLPAILRLYSTWILPIVLFVSECWAPTKAICHAWMYWINGVFARYLAFLRVTTDHITPLEVQNCSKQPALTETIWQRWLGHVSRMLCCTDTCKALYHTHIAVPLCRKTPSGRPRQTWLATVCDNPI